MESRFKWSRFTPEYLAQWRILTLTQNLIRLGRFPRWHDCSKIYPVISRVLFIFSPKQRLRPLCYWSPFMYHNLSLTNRSFTIALGSKQYFIVAFEESSVTLISELTFHKRPYATFLTQPSGILSYSRMIASDLPIIAEGPLVVMWYLTFTDVS